MKVEHCMYVLAVAGWMTLGSARATPVIQSQPMDESVKVGEFVEFAVQATGTGTLIYQWSLNGVLIPGATDDVYNINSVVLADGGSYSVAVGDDSGAIQSEPALLSLDIPFLNGADDFADRTIVQGSAGTLFGKNLDATRESGEPLHAGKPGLHSVWYTWTAPAKGIATWHTRGSAFDTLLAVYQGGTLGSLTPIAGDDDQGGFKTSEIIFAVDEFEEYHLALDGLGEAQGNYLLTLSLEQTQVIPPAITSQPNSITVALNQPAVFSVKASGSSLFYQWLFNGSPIQQANSSSYQIGGVQTGDVGLYAVEIFDVNQRRVLSRSATLEIGPIGSVQSVDKVGDLVSVSSGQVQGLSGATASLASSSAFFSVSVGSTVNQTINNTGSTGDSGVSPHCGIIGGADRWITLTPTENGLCEIDTLGSSIDTVIAVYQWSGSILTTLTNIITCNNDISPPSIRQSRVRFSGVSGRTYWVALDGRYAATGPIQFNLRYGLPPQSGLTPPPRDIFVRRGNNLVLDSGVLPNAFPPAYQWRFNGVAISGSVLPQLTLVNVLLPDSGLYSVEASNWAGTIVTEVARVMVDTMTVERFEVLEGGHFGFRVTGQRGQYFVIDASEDFGSWTRLDGGRLDVLTPVHVFIDTDAPLFPKRFYRVNPALP